MAGQSVYRPEPGRALRGHWSFARWAVNDTVTGSATFSGVPNSWRIIGRHLLPACGSHVVMQGTLLLPAFVLAEATLSFVGLGFPQRIPTWGTMLHDAATVSMLTRFPWLLAPAVAIYAVVLGVNAATHSDKISSKPI